MQKLQAQSIVKETLQNDFDKERFLYFVKNLLNKVDDSKAFHAHGYVPEAYKNYVKTYERLATYTDPAGSKIDILVVYLQKETSLERARTAQRNFVARYLKDRDQKDAGLIAFVSPDPADWRFSLVKMEYKFTEGKTGKTKIKEEFTPAKRWSFLVGKNENSHTAQSRLAPIVEDDETNPTLKQLEDAFNIEKVTKEFFEKYRELFLRVYETLGDVIKQHPDIKSDFAEKNVNTVDFSKKLLGQIVFLYFLQKKGWFGVPMNKGWGNGDKKFLRTLFEEAAGKSKNYFNDYLEPLFYEALAKERDDYFYSRFECKIPFLNGGLFDPISNYDWVNTAIDLPNDIFSNTRKTKDGDTGDGILDIFDRYNFTVKEDEPLEKEVAVDPEMLGKVFENLLEVKDRKSKGTYYTPREIVHYMCEQSLVNYLATELEGKVAKEDLEKLIKIGENVVEHEAVSVTKEDNPEYGGDYKRLLPDTIKDFANEIDDKLATIKVCDPAIGSGAFPVGMMNAIVKARMVLSSYLKDKNRTLYAFKRDCIQNSLYGVDIDPGAVEIAKLRLWLSLVVDEDDIKQIKPLPNLDYKIMQGNSLLEEFEGIKLFDEKLIAVVNTGKEKQLESLRQKQATLQKEYFELHSQNKLTPAKQAELNSELKKLQAQTKKLNQPEKVTVENAGLFDVMSEAKKKADDLKRLHKEFFGATQKSKKDNIKKQIEQLEWELIEATLKEQNKTSALKKLEEFKRSNTKPFFLWKLNFADVFEKGGFNIVIANPPYVKEYVHRSAFDGLRSSPYYQGKMDLWYLFACKGIDLAKDNSGIITFIAQNNWVTSHGASKMRNKVLADTQILSLIDFGDFKIFQAGIQTMVMMFKKNIIIDDYSFDYRRLFGNTLELEDIIAVLDKEKSHKAEYLTPKINRGKFRDKMLTFSNSGAEPILEKILDKTNFHLDANKEVAQGIVTPQDYVNKASQDILGKEFKIGDGIFVLSDDEVKGLKLSKNDLSLVRPFYTTDELKKWHGNPKNAKWIIYTDSSFKDKKKINDFPGIKNHLDRFKKVITSDNKPYGLHRARDPYFFVGEKIFALRKCSRPTFTYADFDCYVSATFYAIKTDRVNQKYLTALLNSKLTAFWLRHKGKMQGNNYQIDKEPILDLPIYKAPEKEQKQLIDLIDRIIVLLETPLVSAEEKAKVQDLENQIDRLVYELYDLNEEEIKIVEAN